MAAPNPMDLTMHPARIAKAEKSANGSQTGTQDRKIGEATTLALLFTGLLMEARSVSDGTFGRIGRVNSRRQVGKIEALGDMAASLPVLVWIMGGTRQVGAPVACAVAAGAPTARPVAVPPPPRPPRPAAAAFAAGA